MKLGVTPFIESDGGRKWQDLCVAATHRGLVHPCDWLEYNIDQNYAWLCGTSPGTIVGGTANYESWLKMIGSGISGSDI
jgi:hypothetical protein